MTLQSLTLYVIIYYGESQVVLRDYIDKTVDVNGNHKLWFCHNLTLSDYEEAKGFIKQKPCNIFPDLNPIYLFYGKPLFNPCKEESFDKYIPGTWPMCLIIPAELIPTIKKAYPFDTGAYHGEPEWAGDDMTKFFKDEDGNPIPVYMFELGTELDTIRRYIRIFFGNNSNYFGSVDNKWAPECREDIPSYEDGKEALVVSRLYDFLRGTLEKLDNRCKSVEFLAVGSYNSSDVVIAFVWPFNNDEVTKSMPNAYPIGYQTDTLLTNEDFINAIADKVRSNYKELLKLCKSGT